MEMEEIIKGLRRCADDDRYDCNVCPYFTGERYCINSALTDAADAFESQLSRIAELERQLEAAVADMKVSNTRKFNNPCEFCRNYGKQCAPVDLQDVCHLWEWRGCKTEEGEPT